MNKYRPSSWFIFILRKVLPIRIVRRFVEVDQREQVARDEIDSLSRTILAKPKCGKQTDKLRRKAQEAAKEVLNGAA